MTPAEILKRIDLQRLALAAALVLSLLAAADVKLAQKQTLVEAVAVVDITGSMNTRDVQTPKGAVSRIAAARTALVGLVGGLPCGSKLGLGIFTERRAFLLYEPIEVCANYDALAKSIEGLNWRMAWEGDSFISKGLYSAIDIAASLKSDLVFLTDGHEAPPLPFTGIPPFDGKPGEVKGIIVGVGGTQKSPIPKYDEDGKEVGTYKETDVPHDNRIGLAPEGADKLEGWNARNAPFGSKAAVGDEHLSSLRADHLLDLARITGLSFVDINRKPDLSPALVGAGTPHVSVVNASISVWPASLALACLALAYLYRPLSRLRAWLGRGSCA